MTNGKTILVFAPSPSDSSKQDLGDWKEKAGELLKASVVGVQVLDSNIREFFSSVGTILGGTAVVKEKGFSLDSIEFNLEITAEGQVGFLGSGAKAAGKGGIKFVLKRAE